MTALPVIDRALARRLEACSVGRKTSYAQAAIALHPAGAPTPPVLLQRGEMVCVWITATSPINGCVGLGMDGPVDAEDLDEVETFFGDRRSPFSLTVCPLADESLHRLVRERGYRLHHFSQVMALAVGEDFQPKIPEGVRIEQIPLARLDEWVLGTSTEPDGSPPTPESVAIMRPNGAGGLMFLAYIDGEVVGGGGLYPTGRAAELGGSSVKPEFRRRGMHAALIQARIAAAVALGCDLITFTSDPGADSSRNAYRAGFIPAYTNVIFDKTA